LEFNVPFQNKYYPLTYGPGARTGL